MKSKQKIKKNYKGSFDTTAKILNRLLSSEQKSLIAQILSYNSIITNNTETDDKIKDYQNKIILSLKNEDLSLNFEYFSISKESIEARTYDIFTLIYSIENEEFRLKIFDVLLSRKKIDCYIKQYNNTGINYFINNPTYNYKLVDLILEQKNKRQTEGLILHLFLNRIGNLKNISVIDLLDENIGKTPTNLNDEILKYILKKYNFKPEDFSSFNCDVILSHLFRSKQYNNILTLIDTYKNFNFQLHHLSNISHSFELANKEETTLLQVILSKTLNHKTTLQSIKYRCEFFKILFLPGWISDDIKNDITHLVIKNIDYFGNKKIKNEDKKIVNFLIKCKRNISKVEKIQKKSSVKTFYGINGRKKEMVSSGDIKYYLKSYKEKIRLNKSLNRTHLLKSNNKINFNEKTQKI